MQLNEIFTISYSQPSEYRFSLDSIFLAQKVNDWLIQQKIDPKHIADVCAGCGVVGLELLFHLKKRGAVDPTSIDFIEVQKEYLEHFEKNKTEMLKAVESKSELNFILDNYKNLVVQSNEKKLYDLIICNPPYFHPGEGKLSPSQFKNRCRFFLDSDFSSLIEWIGSSLNENGSAFLLVRINAGIGSMESFENVSQMYKLKIELFGDVRGTKLFRLTKM